MAVKMHGIGRPVRRKEDRRFITGKGRYTADINLPGQAHLAVLRSPSPHARIKRLDINRAKSAPGVFEVLTAADLSKLGIRSIPPGWTITNSDGTPMAEPVLRALAEDKVAYAGQPIAAVVAATRLMAKDATELIELEFEELPAVADASASLAPGAPRVWDEIPENLCFDWAIGDADATREAFAQASHIAVIDTVQNRLVPNAMEPRAAICDYDSSRDSYTLYTANQNPHLLRFMHCRYTLDVPEHKLRVVAPDVGGGFGSKSYQYPEELLVIAASRMLARPVKWVAERSESFVSDAHGRDHQTHAELAIDQDGRFLALRCDTVANLGAFISMFGAAIPTMFHGPMLCGTYTIPTAHVRVRGAFTNTVPTDAYRGAGRPEATYTVERLVDEAARVTGLNPAEIRRLNLIAKDSFPYESALGLLYDSGNYEQCLDTVLEAANYEGFEARQALSKERGMLRGIGMCAYVEVAGPGPSAGAIAMGAKIPFYEVATVRVNPDGSVTVLTGAHSHGQSHETTFAQIVSERLGVSMDDVEIVHGDTGEIPFGVGTFGSRSLSVGGSAMLQGIDKIVAKGQLIAAHILDAPAEDIEFNSGYYQVKNTDRILAFQDMAYAAYLPGNYPLDKLEPGLEETTYLDPENFTFPSGCHCCEVEIDPETGVTRIIHYVVADDFGILINPMVVEGQVHGGLAQGIGQALLENAVYEPDSGQLLTGSFLDYCMPRADDLPMFETYSIQGESPSNPLGAKGCGEAGAIGAPAAIMNAVIDALTDVGVTDLTMPATPQKVWAAIAAARS